MAPGAPGSVWTKVLDVGPVAEHRDYTLSTLPSGDMVLIGGVQVYASPDAGSTWRLVNAAAAFPERAQHATVVLGSGSLLVIDGSPRLGDVWRSDDGGVTWSELPGAPWTPRARHAAGVTSSGVVVMMAGSSSDYLGDMWTSTTEGASWERVTAAAPWDARQDPGFAVLPDDSLLLFGGEGSPGRLRDVWPNVRVKRATTAGRQARTGDNVPRTARPGLVACRRRSA